MAKRMKPHECQVHPGDLESLKAIAGQYAISASRAFEFLLDGAEKPCELIAQQITHVAGLAEDREVTFARFAIEPRLTRKIGNIASLFDLRIRSVAWYLIRQLSEIKGIGPAIRQGQDRQLSQ